MRPIIKNSKAQVGEYLTTYGWAILLFFVILISFSYLDILDPSRNLPDRCLIGPEFQCLDFKISGSEDTISLLLKNNLPAPIVVTNIEIRSEEKIYPCLLKAQSGFPISLRSGNIEDLIWERCNLKMMGIAVGEKEKIIFNLEFYILGSNPDYDHVVVGEAYGTVV